MKKLLAKKKKNFSKIQALWAGAYKNRIDKPGQMMWTQLYIKCILLIPSLIIITGT